MAVGLALISAVLFGGMSVGLRLGLNRRPDVALATLATVVGAFVVGVVVAIAEAPSRGTIVVTHDLPWAADVADRVVELDVREGVHV